MFYNCSSLNDIKGLYNWNVNKGLNFECMFYNFKKLTNVNGIILWKINSAVNKLNFGCLFNNNDLDNKEELISKFGENSFC